MTSNIPSAPEVRQRLADLTYSQIVRLSAMSEVPFQTLWKVRAGTTMNPGIETVRRFLPLIDAAKSQTADAA